MSQQPPRTFRELLSRWSDADAQMVTSFNAAHIDDKPTTEDELAFANMRLNNVATALATALSMLAQGEDDGR